MAQPWTGVYCALWTPTDEEGRLIESALESNLAFLRGKGLQGLLPLGSTGEFLHLEPSLRKEMIRKLAAMIGSLRIIMNISDIRPRVVLDLARDARQAGAAAVSLLPPYFYPVAQEDLIELFVRAGEAAQLPLFLYNFPERTGNRIAIETVAAVADRVPVAGVKQSGSEFAYHSQLVALGREKNFVVLTGADTRLPEALPLGVAGCVSGLSNAVPELVVQSLEESSRAGALEMGIASRRMAELAKRIPKVHFPSDVAATMEARGLSVGVPKVVVSPGTRQRYTSLVAELRDLFKEWKLI